MTGTLGYAEHAPCAALRRHVACYWTIAGADAAGHRVLPDGCMDLLFDLSGDGGTTATLIGTMTKAIVTSAVRRERLLGVRFRPGEAFAFVTVAAGEATDRVLPLADALGRVVGELSDELQSAADTSTRLAALDRRLLDLRKRARPADPRVRRAVTTLLDSPARARVAWLARDLGLGERQLERTFVERVGIGPKAFARVARLQALVARMAAVEARGSWATLAVDVGYADQAHMIRDVKRLAGVTPSALAREMSDSFNPTPARAATRDA